MKDKLNLKTTPTNINVKLINKDNDQDTKDSKDKQINLIDDYLLKNKVTSEVIINPVKLDSLFSEIDNPLSKTIKNKIEAKLCENIVLFKKSQFKKSTFPLLLSFLKPALADMEKEVKNEFSYFIFRLLESINEFEEKLYNIYKIQLTKFEIKSNQIFKERVSSFVKFSYEYNEFLNEYATWHVKSETIMLNMYILSKYYNKSYDFSSEKFHLNNNIPFDINEFIRYYFLDISILFLKNVNIGLYFFGSVNYTRIILLLLSNYYSGMSIPSIFFSTYAYSSVILGSFVINWIVNYLITYSENRKNLEKFIKMTDVLQMLNKKFDSIQFASSDLISYLILYDLSQQVNFTTYDKKDFLLKQVNEKFVFQKVDHLSNLISLYLSKIDGITKEDIKKIEIESIRWIEKIVTIEQSQDEENGQSVLISCVKDRETTNDDWVLIEMINDYVKKSN